jgi:hypothetical protein
VNKNIFAESAPSTSLKKSAFFKPTERKRVKERKRNRKRERDGERERELAATRN